MLSALFGGAYYDVLQCDTEDGAMAVKIGAAAEESAASGMPVGL